MERSVVSQQSLSSSASCFSQCYQCLQFLSFGMVKPMSLFNLLLKWGIYCQCPFPTAQNWEKKTLSPAPTNGLGFIGDLLFLKGGETLGGSLLYCLGSNSKAF